ncbi:phosphopantetheine-binding protein [Rhodococcoides yunnanense]|uniref:Phosphopantetheine-binding protein n=1 Tax=Rhodococcoides yunnanense TaxID=278209 RepID=A0ABU4BI82_9NOCA|nr:phosphopantetheine-binding protein [Rhodococcus yunnanensis]MDV6263931.1 phosphopantetheine-binding protein [Rhodococcus yunnanensis]
MTADRFTIHDLTRIMREGVGVDEGVDLDGDIVDVEFEMLGYESLALLETGNRIEREYGAIIDDETLTAVKTPRDLIASVNSVLAQSGANDYAQGDGPSHQFSS